MTNDDLKYNFTSWLKKYFNNKINTLDKKNEKLNRHKLKNKVNSSKNPTELKSTINEIIKSDISNLRSYAIPLFLFYEFISNKRELKSIDDINEVVLKQFLSQILKKKRYKTTLSYLYSIVSYFNFIDTSTRYGQKYNFNVSKLKVYITATPNKKVSIDEVLESELNAKKIVYCINTFTKNKESGVVAYNKRLLLKVMFFGCLSVKEVKNIKLSSCTMIMIDKVKFMKINVDDLEQPRSVYIKYSLIKEEFETSLDMNITDPNYLFFNSKNKQYSKISIYKLVNKFLEKSSLNINLHIFSNYFAIFLFNKKFTIEDVLSILGYIDSNIQLMYLNKRNKNIFKKQKILKEYI